MTIDLPQDSWMITDVAPETLMVPLTTIPEAKLYKFKLHYYKDHCISVLVFVTCQELIDAFTRYESDVTSVA